MDVQAGSSGTYSFAGFRLDEVNRSLCHGDRAVALADRLFDALLFLVRKSGRLASRDELRQVIWPNRAVDEGNLDRAMSSLRKALRQAGAPENLIITAPARGYRFGVAIDYLPLAAPAPEPATQTRPAAAAIGAVSGTQGARSRIVGAACVLLVTTVCAGVVTRWHDPAAPPAGSAAREEFARPPRSVAVLDFTGDSLDRKATYFSIGLTDELIGQLGRLPALHVAAHSSSRYFDLNAVSIQDIARRLGVAAVVEGSVRRDGRHVRLNVQLLDGGTGFQIWSQRYDRDADDVLNLQDDLAEAVAGALQVTLVGRDVAAITLGGTRDPRAFDAYLRGMNAMSELVDEAAVSNALAAFDVALARDPNYAMAHLRRARALVSYSLNATFADPAIGRKMISRALIDAQQAVALAPGLGLAHSTLGYVLKFSLTDFARARFEFARGLELAPNDATVVAGYGYFELALGHFAAGEAALEKAAMLDPMSAATYRMLGLTYALLRRYDDAAVALARARLLEAAPTEDDRLYGWTLAMLRGAPATAQAMCAAEKNADDQFCLALALHALGNDTGARLHLAKLQASLGDHGAYSFVQIYAQWGQPQLAMNWLLTALRLRDPGLAVVQFDPWIDPIRSEPGYREIIGKLGLPDLPTAAAARNR